MRSRGAFERALFLALGLVWAAASLGGADDPIKLARRSLDIADYEAAIRYLGRAEAEGPESKDTHALKGYAFYRLGQFDQALGELSKERQQFPDNEDGWILASAVVFEKGDLGSAARLCSEYLATFAENIQARLASSSIGQVAKKHPNGGLPSFILGMIDRKAGREDEADARFREALRLGYDQVSCRVQSIDIAMRTGDWLGALRRAEETRDPALKEGAEILTQEALCLLGLGQREDALAILKTAAEAKPFEAWTVKNLAVGYMEGGRFGAAIAALSGLLRIHPTDFQAREYLNLAMDLRMVPKAVGVQQYSKEFLNLAKPIYLYSFFQDAERLAIQVNAAALELIKAGEFDGATGFLEKFVALYGQSPTLEYNLGQLYNHQEAKAACLSHAWKVIELQPDNRDAWDLAANALFKLRDFEAAVRFYRKAAELDPRDPVAFYNLGCALSGAGILDEAEASWRDAISLESYAGGEVKGMEAPSSDKRNALDVRIKVRVDPISAPACMNLAKLYVETGRIESAIESLRDAIKLAPRNAEPHLELGKIFAARDEGDAAAVFFKKYLELGGDERKVPPYMRKKTATGSWRFPHLPNLSS